MSTREDYKNEILRLREEKAELMRELSELHTLVSAGTGSDAESSVMLKHVSCRLDAILDRAKS